MGTAGTFEIVLRKKKLKFFPKKVLKHTKIKANEHYAFNVSVWIADTPESNLSPTVNLTIQHNGHRLGLCFNEVSQLILAVHELREFVLANAVMLQEKLSMATREFLEAHRVEKPTPSDDYTVFTVIQDEDENLKNAHFDPKTGENAPDKVYDCGEEGEARDG